MAVCVFIREGQSGIASSPLFCVLGAHVCVLTAVLVLLCVLAIIFTLFVSQLCMM